ncbi:MAG: DUF692 family protein [Myxococcaceae bacterium]|nr:DUF692 family protein [Myxococcaceae bacterium]
MKHPPPVLGLGLSSNAQVTDVPRPYELLRQRPGVFDYLEYSAPLDVEAAAREASLFPEMMARRDDVPLVYHPVHLNLFGPATETPERLAQLDRHCATVGSPWVSNDVAWWHERGTFLPGALYLSPPLTLEMLEVCVAHARAVRAALRVPLLLENPTVACARGPLHVLDFMARLSDATGCPVLLDVGHLVSHQLTRGRGLLDGLDDFDCGRVAQLHVAGGVITTRGGRLHYVDDHPQPVRDEVWQLVEHLAPKCHGLRALTFEADGHPDLQALRGLERLRPFAPRPDRSVTGTLPDSALAELTTTGHRPTATHRSVSTAAITQPRPPREALSASEAEACWALFDDVHAGRGDDVAGALAEQDFRLAVLAQALDAEVPWARLALAPGREALLAFMTSVAFRDGFARGLQLRDVFIAWGETRREGVGVGARRLLDFEGWLAETARRPSSTRPTGLATGVRLATYGLDLGEVLFAARAVGRHLRDRAPWSSAGFEGSGVEGVLQAAARAPGRAWTVALRPTGRRVEVIELSEEELTVMRTLETGASLDVPAQVAQGLLRRGLVTRSRP